MKDYNGYDGVVNSICVSGKTYKLQCEIVEVHPLICTRCGAPFELHNGKCKCESCGTNFSAVMSIVEDE